MSQIAATLYHKINHMISNNITDTIYLHLKTGEVILTGISNITMLNRNNTKWDTLKPETIAEIMVSEGMITLPHTDGHYTVYNTGINPDHLGFYAFTSNIPADKES